MTHPSETHHVASFGIFLNKFGMDRDCGMQKCLVVPAKYSIDPAKVPSNRT